MAREDDVASHQGVVFRLHLSDFTQDPDRLNLVRHGVASHVFNPSIFCVTSTRRQEKRWRADPASPRSLIDEPPT